MMHARSRLFGAVTATLLAALIMAPAALADHGSSSKQGSQTKIKGVIENLTWTTTTSSSLSSSSSQPVVIGTLTVLTTDRGVVQVLLTAKTKLEMTAAVLAKPLTGDAANAKVTSSGSAFVASKIEVQVPSTSKEGQTIKGTIASVTAPNGSAPGTLVITTSKGTVNAVLDPNVVVVLANDSLGSLSDLVPGARIQALWKVQQNGYDVVLVRVLSHSSSSQGSSGDN